MRLSRIIVSAAAALLLAVCVISPALYAARNITFQGSGLLRNTAEITDPDLPPPVEPEKPADGGSSNSQTDSLGNMGFIAETDADGKITSLNSNESLWNKDPQEMNYYLRGYERSGNTWVLPEDAEPVLTYAIYRGSLCEYMNNLVIILDFSNFYIQSFGSQFLNGLYYAIWGNWDFSYTTSVDVYDASTGVKDSEPKEVTFNNGNFTVNGITGVNAYSLRIVLPNLGGSETITFAASSLYLGMWNRDVTNIALDLSNTSIRRLNDGTLEGLKISPESTNVIDDDDPTITHFHFIGRTSNQLEFAFANALNYVGGLDTDDDGGKIIPPEGYVTEIFVKQDAASPFTQLFTRVSVENYIRNNSNNITGVETVAVDVIDRVGSSTPTYKDLAAVMQTVYWIKRFISDDNYAMFKVYHQKRDEDNNLAGDKGLVTTDWSNGVTMNDGNTAYLVKCAHNSDVPGSTPSTDGEIGYTAMDNKCYDIDKNLILSDYYL